MMYSLVFRKINFSLGIVVQFKTYNYRMKLVKV